MRYNSDIHHRQSIRLKNYNYSQNGHYFITICTYNRENLFGEITDGKMILNGYGKIAEDELYNTEKMRKDVKIDTYVVMPNHIHVIIEINNRGGYCRGTMHRAPTMIEQFGKPTSNTIPTIIRGFKSAVTQQIKIKNNDYSMIVWQRNYYEHIIRNEDELDRIREYIKNNPANWHTDENFVVG